MLQKSKTTIAIALVWLFHLSGIIGIFTGHKAWFLEKTPLNLFSCFLLLMLASPTRNIKQVLTIVTFFLAGIFVEWIGVSTGFPFGVYHYGATLGAKIDGVPYMIGINWAMLILITGTIASKIHRQLWVRILIGALLMVFLDMLIEPTAPTFDFWHWEADTIPLSNFLAWFIISGLLHVLFQLHIKSLNFPLSLNLYLAQLCFFTTFYLYPAT